MRLKIKMTLKDLINMFFGSTTKQRFKRVILLLIGASIFLMLFFNISYDKKNGFVWQPAGKINIEVKK